MDKEDLIDMLTRTRRVISENDVFSTKTLSLIMSLQDSVDTDLE